MNQDDRLDAALGSLGGFHDTGKVPEGFMDGVWHRAGQLSEAADGRRRLALFAAVFVTGLGGGFWTMQQPAAAEPARYQLMAGAELSPAALLHVDS